MDYGYIFDLDGLLVDTQLPFHAFAESIVLGEQGITVFPQDICQLFSGISTKHVFETLAPELNANELVKRKWTTMHELLLSRQLKAMPGMLEVCSELQQKGISIAIASASPSDWIRVCLRKATGYSANQPSFENIFGKHFVSAENCRRGKPSPDVFLAAKALLPSKPDKNWVAVGDGESDVMAGLAAGMDVLFLSKSNKRYDENPRVRRFTSSSELADHIRAQIPS